MTSNLKLRDLHGLCNRLAEVFNEDDTPDELSTEAREAIEELWKERDGWRTEIERLRAALERYGQHEDGCLARYGEDGDQCSCGYGEFCLMCKGRQPVETTGEQSK